jgi:DNA-binding response OmpR family regulator
VTALPDGEHLVEQLETETPDLLLLDIMMPERSGFDVYNSLQVVLHPMPPVIFLSAKSSIETIVKAIGFRDATRDIF